MLTVNNPWAKGVENTNGQDRNVTTNGPGEQRLLRRLASFRRVCLAITRRWTSCWRHCAGGPWRDTSSFAGSRLG